MSSPTTDLQLPEGAASNPTPWSIQPFVVIGSPVERFQIVDGNDKGVMITGFRERAELIVAAVNAYGPMRTALRDLIAVCERNIYPKPDADPDHPWSVLQRARAILESSNGE